jgi:hypothetical protein
MIRVFEKSSPDFQRRLDALCNRSSELTADIETAARRTIAKVRAGGDAALRALTAEFDKRQLDAIELPASEWDQLASRTTPEVRAAIEHAARRGRVFHERERHASYEISEEGMRVGSRVDPLSRIGIYVPGGKARYPSTVIMTAVPARVAGVREIVMTTPGPSPETLAAARMAGVDRIFVIGGAQAIAAMAYGTETVPRVDKIVGPGNAYVAAAKRLVFGDVGIDSIAGPTEVVIAADDTVDPRWELIRQLVEYKKFKDAAGRLQERELIQENVYSRLPAKLGFAAPRGRPEVSLFDLLNAVSTILKRHNQHEETRDVFEDKWTVSEKIEFLSKLLSTHMETRFSALFATATSRLEVVVTFLALLELIRLKRLEVYQAEPFGEIVIKQQSEPGIVAVKEPTTESTVSGPGS